MSWDFWAFTTLVWCMVILLMNHCLSSDCRTKGPPQRKPERFSPPHWTRWLEISVHVVAERDPIGSILRVEPRKVHHTTSPKPIQTAPESVAFISNSQKPTGTVAQKGQVASVWRDAKDVACELSQTTWAECKNKMTPVPPSCFVDTHTNTPNARPSPPATADAGRVAKLPPCH